MITDQSYRKQYHFKIALQLFYLRGLIAYITPIIPHLSATLTTAPRRSLRLSHHVMRVPST